MACRWADAVGDVSGKGFKLRSDRRNARVKALAFPDPLFTAGAVGQQAGAVLFIEQGHAPRRQP
jgi:hypothetical protein